MKTSEILRGTQLPSSLLGPPHSGQTSGPDDALRHVRLGDAGGCPHEPTVNAWLFDNSGSVTSGNDVAGKRYREAAYALDHVARRCRCGKELVAIYHFDTPTSGDVPPTPLDKAGVTAIKTGLIQPPDGRGASLLQASLLRAFEAMSGHPGHRPILTVVTDWQLFDPPHVMDELLSFNGVIHAIVLNAAPPQRLVDATKVVVTQVQPADPIGAVARAMHASLVTARNPRPPRASRRNRT